MNAYAYDSEGNFIGLVPRQPSPLEPGVWLLPAMSTDKEPLECPEGFSVKFNLADQKWELVEAAAEES